MSFLTVDPLYSVPLQLVVVGCALFMQLKWRPYIAVKGRCGVCGSGLVKKISITCCRGANNRIEIILMVAECLLLISGFANAYVGDTTGLNSGMYGNGTNTTMMNNDNSFNGFNNGINTPSSSFADANGMDVEAVADLTPSSSSLEMYNMSLNNNTNNDTNNDTLQERSSDGHRHSGTSHRAISRGTALEPGSGLTGSGVTRNNDYACMSGDPVMSNAQQLKCDDSARCDKDDKCSMDPNGPMEPCITYPNGPTDPEGSSDPNGATSSSNALFNVQN